MSNKLYLMFLTVLASLVMAHAAAETKPLPHAIDTDARVQSDGKGWRLDQAKIVDASRPRVLLIGDSILNGYGKLVAKKLDGKAYVDLWVNPYCQSEYLNKLLADVLAHGPYDVVLFNMGLHGWQEGRIKAGMFKPLTKAYVAVIRAKLPKAKIIWASSTPVTVKNKPTELDPAINPIITEQNRMAAEVMAEEHVPVEDYYGLLVSKCELARGDQFHWKEEAYSLLAQCAADAVLCELRLPATPKGEPTAAKEAADKKSTAAVAIDAKYTALVAKLPPEEQAWERVLLIGDSVSRGYTLAVRKALAGKANVHRTPENCKPTANGIKKLDLWLDGGKWDVIHFNFGIHDRATPVTYGSA